MTPKDRATLLRRLSRARSFPNNTDPATRHAEIIGRALLSMRPYPMLQEEPEHCAQSILCACTAVYELRTTLADLVRVVEAMDLENEADRPTEAEYRRVLERAKAR